MKAIEDITLKELIPQRPPFVMIDKLVSCDMVFTVTELEVRENNIFVADGRLTAEGLMENIAQTCAARIGYISICRGEKVRIGVIGAVNSFDILQTPKEGERIVTTIEVIDELFKITLVKAVVKCGEKVMAEANMKIALMDIDSQD
jgi:predicted hotdog family 3-hydroxylacyl-ACP dehydratase